MIKKIILVVFILFLAGCSQKNINVSAIKQNILTSDMIKVVEFKNNTSTPLAGKKVSAIVEATLTNKGYYITNSNSAKYVVSGTVNEWRYKTGIDGEPAVSYSVTITSRQNGLVIFSGIGSKSADGYESLGTTAQDISDEIFDKF